MGKMMKNITGDVLNNVGLLYKNPTHLEESRGKVSQSEIVKMVTNKSMTFRSQRTQIDYSDNSGKTPLVPGMKNLKSMGYESIEDITSMLNTLFRLKPRIYRAHIVLGDYSEKQRIEPLPAKKIINFNKPRSTEEITSLMAEIFANKQNRVVELAFWVAEGSFQDNSFRAQLEVYSTSEEEWEDESKEKVFVELDWFGVK
jgi:hypothetical protein